jgi:hypothetical protein
MTTESRSFELPLPDLGVIDAWVDGEPVDADAVDARLATDEGRAYAIDVMALRRACQTDVPAQALPDAPARWRPWAAAAAILVTAGAGFLAGLRAAPVPEGNPLMAIRGEEGIPAAPTPTRVIQFEVGVDWRESTGGN